MMIRFKKKKMTLKTTLLVWELMVTSNGLVSYMTGPDKRVRPLMTSTNTMCSFPLEPTCIITLALCP
jgi:hypothetical protein